jgi:N-acetylmuramoyl-L-alanine amidase
MGLNFLANKTDEKKIMNMHYQNTFANVMVKTIDEYFEIKKAKS